MEVRKKSVKEKWDRSLTLLKITNKLKSAKATPSGPKHPKVKIDQADRQTYHCRQMRKIHISKCDPCMAFAFYLRNEADFRQFYWLMKRGKEKYAGNWPFSLMDIKVMENDYFEHYNKDKQSTINPKVMRPSTTFTRDMLQSNISVSNAAPLDTFGLLTESRE